ncbi:MAG: stage 0 sporulation protein, partial [Oscillospiraceae bacterium]|nr:stage 0 sporulation protein [Oscillospiraceae bacterium]
MTTVVGVRFKKVSKMYYFNPNGLPLEKGMPVIIDTQAGTEYGVCVTGLFEVEDERIVPPLRKVL